MFAVLIAVTGEESNSLLFEFLHKSRALGKQRTDLMIRLRVESPEPLEDENVRISVRWHLSAWSGEDMYDGSLARPMQLLGGLQDKASISVCFSSNSVGFLLDDCCQQGS